MIGLTRGQGSGEINGNTRHLQDFAAIFLLFGVVRGCREEFADHA